jgi:hypothetical protein
MLAINIVLLGNVFREKERILRPKINEDKTTFISGTMFAM